MADYSEKNIEDVVEGDIVLSYNVSSNKIETSKVIRALSHNTDKNLVVLTFDDGNKIYTTTTHPFYTTSG
jgi:hypothetical protein